MKILITGFVAFVIWSVFTMWLYVDRIKPSMKAQVNAKQTSENKAEATNTPVKAETLMPEDLLFYFEFDGADVKADSRSESRIAELKSWLGKNPGSMLQITGHTDMIGTDDYNMALGLRRAMNVKKYLESRSIPAERMIIRSRGGTEPAGVNYLSAGRAKNRRTVVTIKK
jgi:outer membrane protein OmpA-like peptidoglycan-associated protein